MKIIKPYYEILMSIDGIKELQQIEVAARVCYKSEEHIKEDGESAKKLVAMLIKSGHEAMLEHSQLSVKFIVDRGVSHEIVRHRLFSFAQESQRYCAYNKDKFGNEVTFIKPPFYRPEDDDWDKTQEYDWGIDWYRACKIAEESYFRMLANGASP